MNNTKFTEFQYYKVNAFAEGKCKGNPAVVCLMPEEKDDRFYKQVAIAINASETAFVCRRDDTYSLRWFTKNGTEVELCGHATLAASWILWNKNYADKNKEIAFSTKSGILSAKFNGEFVTLDFPLEKVAEVNESKYDFHALMGIEPLYLGRTRFDYLIVVDSEKIVKALKPDFEKLKAVQTRGIIVTARSHSSHYDYFARFFAPLIGVDEDPVTGSIQCCLVPYGSYMLGKDELVAYQASKEGGILCVKILKERILLSGKVRETTISSKTRKILPI